MVGLSVTFFNPDFSENMAPSTANGNFHAFLLPQWLKTHASKKWNLGLGNDTYCWHALTQVYIMCLMHYTYSIRHLAMTGSGSSHYKTAGMDRSVDRIISFACLGANAHCTTGPLGKGWYGRYGRQAGWVRGRYTVCSSQDWDLLLKYLFLSIVWALLPAKSPHITT